MVHLFNGYESALPLAFLAQGICFDVAVADSLPGPPVSFARCRVAFVPVVALGDNLLMFGAVLPSVCKPTASGVGARTLGFVGHQITSLGTKQKPPGISLLDGSFPYCFCILILLQNLCAKVCQSVPSFKLEQ